MNEDWKIKKLKWVMRRDQVLLHVYSPFLRSKIHSLPTILSDLAGLYVDEDDLKDLLPRQIWITIMGKVSAFIETDRANMTRYDIRHAGFNTCDELILFA